MKKRNLIPSTLIVLGMLASMLPAASAAESYADAHTIVLSSTENADGTYTHSATYDGDAVAEYDYTWHADPSEAHDEVKNAPAEYYTGTEPGDEAVYIAHDIYYYPELDEDAFVLVNYDGDQEWAYYYTAEGYEDYIFATLPVSGSSVPTDMMHSEEEAYQNAVLHITQAGTYILEGEWHGQIWIDLGDTDDTFTDEDAKVTIILNGVDVTCTVAPALVFYSVYECDNTWEDQSSWSAAVDTSDAGANVIIADGTVNNFTGENIYRMLKTQYKDETQTSGVPTQKKMRKLDGAFYSYVSMNVDEEPQGTGLLNITAGYEGLDTELHLTINGGNINIFSQDDGINVNEDGVSVVTVNDGSLHILAGLGSEGDGIDSNGFLVINGGTVVSLANPNADSGLDSDFGSYINGGTVVALGSTMDWAEADDSNGSDQVTMNLQFSGNQSADEAIIITDTDGNVVFAYDPDKDEVTGSNARWYQGAIISCEALEVGQSYFVYVGGDVYGTETAGLYDVSTVTGFTSGAKQQSYTGTDVGFGGPGGMGGGPGGGMGGGRPDDGTLPEDGTFPEDGFVPGQFEGMEPGAERPDGVETGEMPEREQGEFAPGGMDGQFGGNDGQSGTVSIYFTMTDQVNGFSGVSDYDGSTSSFTDVASGSWYESAVNYVYENGLMTGTSATTFAPLDTTTRGMLMTILARLDGTDTSASSPWYQTGMEWAVENQVSDGTNPEGTITREQIVTMLWRYAGQPESSYDLSAYTDGDGVSNWAQTAMAWAVETGLITGTSSTTLNPGGDATRAELATILMRFCESVLNNQ